ncbi:MAG: hypothetical protein VB085_03855 [Peptococcaceae bacterium]|nr:hypothetical protein [Peptococcaceae bacterium]
MLRRFFIFPLYLFSFAITALSLYICNFYLGLSGFCRDAGLVLVGWADAGLWLGALAAIILLAALIYGLFSLHKKGVFLLTLPLILVLSAFSMKAAKVHEDFYWAHEKFQPRVVSLSLDELAEKTKKIQIAQYIFIGGASNEKGEADTEVYSRLEQLSRVYQQVLHSYDPAADRQSRREKLTAVFDESGITAVPSLMKIENGEITIVSDPEKIPAQAEEWFNKTPHFDLQCFKKLSEPRPASLQWALTLGNKVP